MLIALSPEMVVGLVCVAGMVASRNPMWGAAFAVAFVVYHLLLYAAEAYMGTRGDDGNPPLAGA